MRMKELAGVMFRAYFLITTGVTISMFLFCLIFKPDTLFSMSDIGGILLIAFISDLSFFVFCSNRELGKKQMIARFIIHVPVLLAILLMFGHLWNWYEIQNPAEVLLFTLLVLGVYAVVMAVTFYQDKKTTDKLNELLKRRYHS